MTDIRPINLPDNSPISIGRDHSRPSYNQLFSTRVGIVSIYQRSLSVLEINALYNDYKINFQNIPLISDTLATFDLTKGETVSRDEIKDLSGNGNDISTTYGSDLYYDSETSIVFASTNRRLFWYSNMLGGNVSMTFNIWILINSQTGPVPTNDQRILTLGGGFHLTLVITDNDLYGLSFGIENQMGERAPSILKPDLWFVVTGTRNVLTDDYELYVDNVIVKGASNSRVLNMDTSIRLAYPTVNAVNTDDFQIGQIGTVNIFEKALNLAEIEDLYYLYNVRLFIEKLSYEL
jgi:hypothetical protein